MKRVLIVSPSFPPINSADMHRVRTSLAFYRDFGWQPHVLAVSPDAHGGLQEPELSATVPDDVQVTRCGAVPRGLTRAIGITNAGLRALGQMYYAGAALIEDQRIDLVYFSTTMFPVLTLGRLWKARHGTPYVFDMQDPWKSDYAGAGAPRGLKARAARALHARLEPFAMRRVDGIVSVSPAYSETLQRRYPWIHPDMCATIPFGASATDFEAAARAAPRRAFFSRGDGHLHGASVGRGGGDLATAATILLHAVRLRDEQDGRPGRTRLFFIGTDYAVDTPRKTIAPIAARAGLSEAVEEWPARIPYLEGLRTLASADFCVILGSDDPTYSPSKVYPCLLTGRPFVAVLHEASPVVPLLRQSGAGVVATFAAGDDPVRAAATLAAELPWVLERTTAGVKAPAAVLDSISARTLTERQCAAFDAAVRHASPLGIPCIE
jgi:hypothetical protein